MQKWKPGSLFQLIGYQDEVGGEFSPGDLLAAAAISDDGVLTCFQVDFRGRVFSAVSETIFVEEVRLLMVPPIPLKSFPPPWGEGDNSEDDQKFAWTGCLVGSA